MEEEVKSFKDLSSPIEEVDYSDEENTDQIRSLGFSDDDILEIYGDDGKKLDEIYHKEYDRAMKLAEDLTDEEPIPPYDLEPLEETRAENPFEDTSSVASSEEDLSPEQLRELARFGLSWQNAFARDPVGTLRLLINSNLYTPEEKERLADELAGALTGDTQTVDFNPREYEPETELERALLPSYDWLTAGPYAVQQALLQRDMEIRYTYAHLSAINEKLDALARLLEVEIPAFNVEPVFQYMQKNPQKTVEEAVREVYGNEVRKKSKVEKQKQKERPDTLRQQSASNTVNTKPKTIQEMYRLAGVLLGEET